jgi:hypothetical protein
VCDEETSKNEEAKACYWAVKIQPQWVVTPGKQTNKKLYTLINQYACHEHKNNFYVIYSVVEYHVKTDIGVDVIHKTCY